MILVLYYPGRQMLIFAPRVIFFHTIEADISLAPHTPANLLKRLKLHALLTIKFAHIAYSGSTYSRHITFIRTIINFPAIADLNKFILFCWHVFLHTQIYTNVSAEEISCHSQKQNGKIDQYPF